MLDWVLKRTIGRKNDRMIRRYQRTVDRINELEASFQKLTDAQIQEKTEEFKKRLANFLDKTRQNKQIGFGGIKKYY